MSNTEIEVKQEIIAAAKVLPASTDAVNKFQNTALDPALRANALGSLIDLKATDLIAIMPKHVTLNRIKQMFVLQAKQNPGILECDPQSLMQAVFTAASLGLEPNPQMGLIYILPFKNNKAGITEAQVIVGYKGLIQLAKNSGNIGSIQSEAIYQNDEFNIDLMNPQQSYHRPFIDGERGEIKGFYAMARLKGEDEPIIEYMSKGQVDLIKANSVAFKNGYGKSPWDLHYGEMGRKTVLKRLIKRLPLSCEKLDEEGLSPLDKGLAFENQEYRQQVVDTETGEVTVKAPKQSKLEAFAS
jgi:recombination protein RecT